MITDVDKIIQTVAEEYRVSSKAIINKTRIRDVAEARQMCMFLMRKRGMFLKEIGAVLNRTHNSVYYGCNTINNLIQVCPDVAKHYEAIKEKLGL